MSSRSNVVLRSILGAGALVALVACSGSDNSRASGTASAKPAAVAAAPSWATVERFESFASPAETVQVQVHLQMRNAEAARAELAAITNPDSPAYGHFLSDAEYAAKYAPTEDDVAQVRAHLEAEGLTVVEVPANRAYIRATGAVSNVEHAFSTRIAKYRVDGELRHAAISTPTVPAALQSRVAAVLGLTTNRMVSHSVRVGGVRVEATSTTLSCSEWWGQHTDTADPVYSENYDNPLPVVQCGFKPGSLRAAYGLTDAIRKGNDGTGVSIAIVDAYESPTLLADAQTYFANNDPDYPLSASQFSAQMAPGTATTVDTGWYDEQTLDVEAVHTMAPGAKIAYVGAQSSDDQDLVAAINLILTNHLATIVSNSYGSPEQASPQNYVVWENIAQQAGLKGVGLYFSSGDDGDENAKLGFPSADFPASLATVTAVGGTSLAVGENGQAIFETGWESGRSQLLSVDADGGVDDSGAGTPTWTPAAPGAFKFGAGGGFSAMWPQPTYQAKVVPAALSNASVAAARVVPDVAMLADPVTGFMIGITTNGTYGESPIGGTSLACPLFAGVMALAQQHAKHTLGFANPALYKAYGRSAYRDITPLAKPEATAVRAGAVYTFDFPGLTIHTAVGYDNVTGMGVPNGSKFLSAIR